METITISPRFFKHELNNYSDWKKAFWRELVQNSVDENCSRIEVKILETDGVCEISFEDNGPGMTEETMRNIYFQLGATGKEGADTIGGHGRARILTCFAHQHYEIRTQGLLCKGEGGHYEIDNSLPFFKGCTVKVWVSEASDHQMERALTDYLKNCQLPCQVRINEIPFTTWLYKRKATRALSFGTVHTNKTFSNTTICRVRGVSMFERYCGCPTGTILEIEGPKSREVLTVSRDNLKYDWQAELDIFLSEITLDHKSINRDCSLNKTEIFGNFRKIGKRIASELAEKAKEAQRACSLGSHETIYHGMSPAYGSARCPGTYPADAQIQYELAPDPQLDIPYSVHYEDAPKNIRASAKRFHPEEISGTRLKLLAAWDATLQFVLESLEEWKEKTILFLPGFAFGQCLGLHKEEKSEDGTGHILYINPIDSNGKIRVSCHDTAELYATAIHECSHILQPYHDEEYAGIQTQLTALTSGKLGELKSRIRKAVAAINKKSEESAVDFPLENTENTPA